MAFKLVYHSQQGSQWKSDILGFGDPSDTIGYVGCALTSVAMLLSGHGYAETPRTLNKKLKDVQGFVSAGIRWGAVSQIYPNVTLKAYIPCSTSDAPLAQIDAAIAAGQPAIVQVDANNAPGIQTHWVVVYGRKGDDYLMLDPWPYQTDITREDLLMKRYARGNTLKRAISHVILYEAYGSGGPISTPSTPTTTPAPTSGVYARVQDSVTWGLNLRSSIDTSSMANVVASVPAGTQLLLLEPDGASKIGGINQWVRVREPGGREGFAAAWYLEKAAEAAPTPVAEPVPGGPVNEPPVTPSTTPAVDRSRPSIGDGLENVPLAVSADQRINDNSLLARIWNKYGGLLSAIAQKMNFDPAIAVAILAVESGGQPYGSDGRLIIRFENHLFFEYWGKRNTSKYNHHFKSGSPIWTGHQWRPKANAAWRDFHGNQSAEWEVLTFASELDDTAAKKSISMGLPQVLGSNFGILGFASVQDMFNAFVANERNQVIAFFDFLQGNGPSATNALKARDFRTIASIYNGAGNADHYGRLIEDLYNTFITLRGNQPPVSSTPTTTPPATPTTPSAPSTPTEPSQEKKLTLVVSEAVGTSGLRMRKTPSKGGTLVMVLKAGTKLTVVEPAGKARAKVGKANQWVYVREPNGKRGYVGAEYVKVI